MILGCYEASERHHSPPGGLGVLPIICLLVAGLLV